MKTLPYDPFNDRVIAAAGRYQAVHDQQAVLLPDSQVITMHRVRLDGIEDTYLRAVSHGDFLMVVFNLVDVAPNLWGLHDAPAVDVPGLILFSLRAMYPTAAEARGRIFRRPVYTLKRSPAAQPVPALQGAAA